MEPPRFAIQYGWKVDQMAHDIEHAHKNGCPYCHRSFSEMGGGLSDVSLDIWDPQKQPFYALNTRWVCRTCNKEKQRTPPELFGEVRMSWERWERHQTALRADPLAGLPLFQAARSLL
jgi:hypothetical protein